MLTVGPPMLPAPIDTAIFRRLETGAVVLASDAEVYYGLNDVGATIWELLGQPGVTLDGLVAGLGTTYPDVGTDRLRTDADALIASLVAYGLLRMREGAVA